MSELNDCPCCGDTSYNKAGENCSRCSTGTPPQIELANGMGTLELKKGIISHIHNGQRSKMSVHEAADLINHSIMG